MAKEPRTPRPMSREDFIDRLRGLGIELATAPEPRPPRPMAQWEKDLIARLKEDGIEITSSTLGPDDPPYPEPIDIGCSLSDEIIRMRRA